MRAAEILAEMLLNEARVFGIVYGPQIPAEGYWLQGTNLRDMVSKLAVGLNARPTQQAKAFIDTIIKNGYQLVTNISGNVVVYGINVPDLSPKAAQILAVGATTPVYHMKQYAKVDPAVTPATTGKDAFGIDMTPDEKQQLAQQKAAAKAQAKQKWHDLTPEEEEEFNQWAVKSGKTPAGLASTWGPGMPGTPAAP